MDKDPNAVALGKKGGKKRWKNKTPEEIKAHMSMMGKKPKKKKLI